MLTKIKKYICPQTGKPRYSYDFSFMRDGKRIRLRQQGYLSESEAREALELAYFGIKHGFREPPVVGTTRGRKRTRKPVVTLLEVLEKVKEKWASEIKPSTLQTYMYKLNRYVVPYIGDHDFAKLKDADITGLYQRLNGVAFNHVTAPIKSIIKYARDLGLAVPTIDEHTWKLTKTKKREEYLTAEEVKILLEKCEPKFRHLFALLVYTGMRVGEIRGLNWSDVSLANRTIRIERQLGTLTDIIGTPKSGKTRTIPIDENVLKILKSYASTKGSKWIVSGRMFSLGYDVIQREVVRCREFIGKDIVVHSLRHTAASLMIQANVPMEKIGAILGQSTANITAQYAHLSTDSLRSAIAVLPDVSF